MNKEKEESSTEKDENFDTQKLYDFIHNIVNELKITEILEQSKEIKIKKIEADKTFNSRNLTFWQWKFSKDIIVCILLLSAIITLSMNCIIKESITGTLLGSVIGYTIGNGIDKNRKD